MFLQLPTFFSGISYKTPSSFIVSDWLVARQLVDMIVCGPRSLTNIVRSVLSNSDQPSVSCINYLHHTSHPTSQLPIERLKGFCRYTGITYSLPCIKFDILILRFLPASSKPLNISFGLTLHSLLDENNPQICRMGQLSSEWDTQQILSNQSACWYYLISSNQVLYIYVSVCQSCLCLHLVMHYSPLGQCSGKKL